jgi:signal transduction histidine kinase
MDEGIEMFKLQQVRTDWMVPWVTHTSHQVGSWAKDLLSRARGRVKKFQKPKEEINTGTANPEIIRLFQNFSKWAGIIAIMVGYHVLLGWLFDIRILTSPGMAFSTMKTNAAICSILTGISLLQARKGCLSGKKQLLVRICSGITIVIAFLTLTEYLFGWHLSGDKWLFSINETQGGRMAFTTALAFLMLGTSMILIDRPKSYHIAESLALISAVIALFAVTGYMYRAQAFYGQMPLYASFVIFVLSIGILFARGDRGFMAKITSNSFGGIMARRLLPATLITPIAIGWLQYEGQRRGIYQPEPGSALSAVANVVIFLSVIWWSVNSLHRMDTKRRQAEKELQETAAKLGRSNADLEQFAYVTSHDLKEPLRAISGSVQILQNYYKDNVDPDIEEVIKHTVDGSRRMQHLIDDLLTYSRLTTREAPLELIDSSEIYSEALSNLQTTIEESKAIVTCDALPTVKADRVQFLQVFQNLISNAIKYRSTRTPKIHVGVEDRSTEWLFSIRDNGIGIAPQYANRIFRLFQRLHTRKEYSGTGIGLAICKKVIERHGGRIWVESEPEEGSTFYFTLPK